jgi:peptide/nickel transport system substrate-binding protein
MASTRGPAHTPGAYGSLPKKHGKAKHGGTITIGQITGTTPDYILPITPAAQGSIYTADFQDFMWRPLYWSPNGDAVPSIDYADSIAKAPKWSNNNKTLTMDLKNYKWSDGKPVTATDAVFDYWLFKAAIAISPANEGNYTPGLYPDNVSSVSAPNAHTIVVHWTKTYNQDFLLFQQVGLLEPLPAQTWATDGTKMYGANSGPNGFENLTNAEAIYKYISGQSGTESTYATNPLWKVVDGPFHVKSFDPATGAYTLSDNPSYSGHHPLASTVKFVTYTSTTAQFNAELTNGVNVAGVDQSDLARVGSLKANYYVWGEPNFGWNYIPYNFKDTTGDFNNIIDKLYIRQALAHLQNESAEISSRGIWDGAAAPAYGPVPSIPKSPLAPSNAAKNPYPFSIKEAKTILTDHGWHVVKDGQTTCARPGTGAKDCGAGIPKGTKLSWNLFYATGSPTIPNEDEAWASNCKQVGINMTLAGKTFNFLISNFNDVSAPKNDNQWAMEDFGGFTGVEYPTTNQVFNKSGSFNLGGFYSPQIDTAIHNSIYSLSNSA